MKFISMVNFLKSVWEQLLLSIVCLLGSCQPLQWQLKLAGFQDLVQLSASLMSRLFIIQCIWFFFLDSCSARILWVEKKVYFFIRTHFSPGKHLVSIWCLYTSHISCFHVEQLSEMSDNYQIIVFYFTLK